MPVNHVSGLGTRLHQSRLNLGRSIARSVPDSQGSGRMKLKTKNFPGLFSKDGNGLHFGALV